MSHSPVKAVLYPARSVAGYAHIYSLGVAGIPVVALHSKWGFTFPSRYVKEHYVTPDAALQPKAFVDWLVQYGRRQKEKPVLFLAEDLYAFIVSANAETLSGFYHYTYLDRDSLPLFFDKRMMYREAEAAGLNVPPTMFSPLDADRIQNWNHYPAVVKPVVSRFSFSGVEVQVRPAFPKIFKGKALLARNRDELTAAVRAVEKEGFEYCVQRQIPGPNEWIYNVRFVADRDGRIPSCFISRKQRQQPADFGTVCVSVSDYVEELHLQAQAFCSRTRYCGPGGMEFKRDSDSGRFWFIEVNPRLGHGLRSSVLKGVNLPVQQYRLSLGRELKSMKQENGGAVWIDIERDLKGKWWRSRNSGYAISWKTFLRPYRSFHEAVWNRQDPIPGLLNFSRMIPSLIRSYLSDAFRPPRGG